MSKSIAVVGAGSWGTTFAALTSQTHPTLLWARDGRLAEAITSTHRNDRYLAGFELPDSLRASASLAEVVSNAEILVMAVPSGGYRAVAAEVARHLRPRTPVLSLTKGLDHQSLERMSQVTRAEMPQHPVAVLTGPNLAKEILTGQPAASVIASDDAQLAVDLQHLLRTPSLRIYTSDDLIGCELGGVMKNIIAIAAGMVEGLDLGDNTRAALLTRGLAEMTRLGVALGGRPETFAGLSGMGDLIVTCSSHQSRNHTVGVQLGRGRTIEEVLVGTSTVAEGVRSSSAVLHLARRLGVDLPITEQVVAVCHEGRPVVDALASLMDRLQRSERD